MAAVRLEAVRVRAADLLRGRADAEDAAGAEALVLDGVSLACEEGGVLAVLGESGGGKSTLLRLCNRLVEPSAGRALVEERPVEEWPLPALRRHAVLVGQRAVSFGGSVGDELSLPARWAGRTPSEESLREVLGVVGLGRLSLERDAARLSGGERTRLGLARALLLEPRVLLLDEPTGSLDVRTARELLGRLGEWARSRGVARLVVTHRPADLAALGGRAVFLLGGRLHGPFPADAVLDGGPADPAVRAFLGTLGRAEEDAGSANGAEPGAESGAGRGARPGRREGEA